MKTLQAILVGTVAVWVMICGGALRAVGLTQYATWKPISVNQAAAAREPLRISPFQNRQHW